MKALRIAAVDMGGTQSKAFLLEADRVLEAREVPSRAREGGAALLSQGKKLLEGLWPFDALGVATAGQVDPAQGVIRYANDNIPGYTGAPVRAYFQEKFPVPVAVENDVCAAALGEGLRGAAREQSDYMLLTYGTGVGGAVVLENRLYRGAGASAGIMLGGLITHPERTDPKDPFAGCYERSASASALVRRGLALDAGLSSGRAIFARLEEPAVQALVDAWLDQVAAGLCTLIHAYNVPCLVLGGGVMEQPYAVQGARRRALARLIPGFQSPSILGAALGNRAGLWGAAHLARQALARQSERENGGSGIFQGPMGKNSF